MKFRFGLFVGIAIGYVLGSRAGYERYQQIQKGWRSVRRSEPAQRLTSEVRDLADRTSSKLEQKASRGMDQISDQLRSDADGNGTSEMDRMR